MKKPRIDDYRFIELCRKIINILLIVALVLVLVFAIVAAVIAESAWPFFSTFITGVISAFLTYVFGMLLLTICHNVYETRVNTDALLKKLTDEQVNIDEETKTEILDSLKKTEAEVEKSDIAETSNIVEEILENDKTEGSEN